MDNDRVGKLEAKWLQDNYSIVPIIIPKKYKVKDFAELYNTYNIRDIAKLINYTIKKIIEYGRTQIQHNGLPETSNSLPY